ncbi:proto-oncogene tyrosine-protein kinase receptor Ret-like isoform X2 [Eriocheir sinensis]|uniref:proto-oncogene tyrosine-protein kinase receptor Ret-like isoform X2 n=1 Tax=Eriocheir sinensis TaxID=95602 RepID=UPI0021CA5E42|nr:proto-oncogene tyrosine-protein kinase receptor Ret-like isoform X2 [Eriocheir sinensis]
MKGCFPWLSSPPPRLPLLVVVVVSLTHLSAATEQYRRVSTWYDSDFSLKLPEDFPANATILSLAPVSPRRSPLRTDLLGGGGGAGGDTLPELRVPREREQNSISSSAWVKYELLENKLDLFQIHQNPMTGVMILSLRRPFAYSDWANHEPFRLVEAVLGPVGAVSKTKCGNGKRGNGKNGNGRIRNGEGGVGKDCSRGDPEADRDKGIIYVKIQIVNSFKCDKPPEAACYLPEETLKLIQWENSRSFHLLGLPSPATTCPNLVSAYSITMTPPPGDNREAELWTPKEQLTVTSTTLDRERRGETINFTVTCALKYKGKPVLAPQTKQGTLTILDEDDSPPIRSRRLSVDWHYSNKTDDLDEKLMVVDADLTETNNYKMELVGSTYNLVTIQSVNKFKVSASVCSGEVEGINFTADCTVLTPLLMLNQTRLTLITLNQSGQTGALPHRIHFSVVFIDTTLLMPGESRKVMYNVTLTLPGFVVYDPTKSTAPPHSSPDCDNEQFRLLWEMPPTDLNITVTLPATRFQRLGQLGNHDLKYPLAPGLPYTLNFTIVEEPGEGGGAGVGITPVTGILYVSDPTLLRSGEFVVERGNGTATTIISLLVLESVDPKLAEKCQPKVTESADVEDVAEETEPTWCSSFYYEDECEGACGVGSAGGCQWRPYQPTNYTVSEKYGACSPNLSTCPDQVCDELEMSFQSICPYDCVVEEQINSRMVKLRPNNRGIEAGFGVCSCNSAGCQCFSANKYRPDTFNDSESPQKTPTMPPWCNNACKVGVSLAGFAFLSLTLFCGVFCRRRAMKRGKQKGGVISLGALPSEDRSSSTAYNSRETHDSVIHGIRSSPRGDNLSLIPALNLTIDRKWEFPRNRLVIEQTLGEGEFGKVMKAKAQGIGGNLGYTTVAVKMLKSNSTPAELADLLSEYSLLKDVSHPNVVRLLGACTSKGGPIYIIIEYCQYGSLRNYLKRSRHAEFENRVGSGPAEGTTADYAITPKDILSFAWQICKGMAYLTDMKLVHRDLAARNVLLAAGKVCKISDFGLTRDVYEGDLYFKRSKGRVPVKWMALESLVDHVYTSKSDVWGFGVLLWELVTLGTPPYPGVTPERLFSLLKAGYRMERPDNCSQELYDVMLQCWAEDPARRPCFQDLTDIFESMIQADVEYLELRSLIVTNRGYFDGLPDPMPPQILDAPIQFQDSPQPSLDPATQSSAPQGPPQLSLQEVHTTRSPARPAMSRPRREESSEPLLGSPTAPTHAPTITTSHAHNPAYSPTSETPPPPHGHQHGHPPLHYSTLATRPDEEDAHTLECSRSEEDSDSGRATGDSGYATEEGRGRWRAEHKGGSRAPQASSPRGSSYSPVPRHDDPEDDPEDDQDTSEDLEERQELLAEDLLGHLTPSPEPAHTAHSTTRTAHTSHAAHLTAVIV